MASDSSYALRVAVLARLLATSDVTDRVTAARIKSVIRATKTARPFIEVVGVVDADSWDTKTTDGLAGTFEVHVISKQLAAGAGSCEAIMAAILDALDDAPLAPVGHAVTVFRLSGRSVFEEPDGESYHGVLRFAFMTCA